MFKPIPHEGIMNMKSVRQINEAFRYTVDREKPVVAGVSGLLRFACPAAVAWLVISIVVFAFKHCPARSISHVEHKVFEHHPPLTHRNSPSSVVVKRVSLWIGASLNHVRPRYVRWGHPGISGSVAVNSCKSVCNKRRSFRHRIGSFFAVFSGGRPATTGARYDSFMPYFQKGVNT